MSTSSVQHLAIIMDGNGRWANRRGWPRILGHREGARNVTRITTACSDRGIKILTLYAFSAENWSRPPREVDLLMRLLKIYAIRQRPLFMRHQVRLKVIGDFSKLPEFARQALQETMHLTAQNTGMILQLALSYGGRDEIVRAFRKLAASSSRDVFPSEVTETSISNALDTAGQKDPDLIIRTSGEQRLSNFLIWQAAYAEFYFTDSYWPDFSAEELDRALNDFAQRERRFGRIDSRQPTA